MFGVIAIVVVVVVVVVGMYVVGTLEHLLCLLVCYLLFVNIDIDPLASLKAPRSRLCCSYSHSISYHSSFRL